jgi:beta-galactosidase beta subunit
MSQVKEYFTEQEELLNTFAKFIDELEETDFPEPTTEVIESIPTTIQDQIKKQIEEGKKPNPIDDIFGQCTDDMTDEEFEKMMEDLKNDK